MFHKDRKHTMRAEYTKVLQTPGYNMCRQSISTKGAFYHYLSFTRAASE